MVPLPQPVESVMICPACTLELWSGSMRNALTRAVCRGLASLLLTVCLTCQVALAADLTAREVTQQFFKSKAGAPVDFSGKDLSNLDLAGLDFKHAILKRANLFGADLSAANLSGADLAGARLDRATLIGADFSGANMEGAIILKPSVFSSMKFDYADAPKFVGTNLRAVRIAARMDGTDFRGADMSRASIGPFDTSMEAGAAPSSLMMGADFSGANLSGAEIRNVNLTFGRFVTTDLRGAKLLNLDLSRADFSGANLTGAEITGSNFDGANLTGAKGLETLVGVATAKNFARPTP